MGMVGSMSDSFMSAIDALGLAARAALLAAPGPSGRERVRELLRVALRDPVLLQQAATWGAPRRVLYTDAELGFCILAHAADGAGGRVPPHDHGPSWAIYGQAAGTTQMTDYRVLSAAAGKTPGRVVSTSTYLLNPGDAHLYNEGDVHAPRRDGPTRLIRIEGQNLESVPRARYEDAGSGI